MSLKEKAAKINFSVEALSEAAAVESATKHERSKTIPGAMMGFANERRSAMLEENEALKMKVENVAMIEQRLADVQTELQQWDGAKGARHLQAEEVGRSKFANRHHLSFEGEDFAQLRAEIAHSGGNVQPIKVRPVTPVAGSPVKYEIIYGHRRHEACRLEGLPVFAIIDNLDDQTLFIEMDRENRTRQNLTPWEQGLMYKNAIDNALFPSHKKMSAALGVDLGLIGKAVTLASLPEDVVSAFNSPLELQYRWAKPLADAVSADKKKVIERAKQIQSLKARPSAADVFAQLTGTFVQPVQVTSTPILITQDGSKALIRTSKKGQTVVEFSKELHEEDQRELAKFIENLLAKQGG